MRKQFGKMGGVVLGSGLLVIAVASGLFAGEIGIVRVSDTTPVPAPPAAPETDCHTGCQAGATAAKCGDCQSQCNAGATCQPGDCVTCIEGEVVRTITVDDCIYKIDDWKHRLFSGEGCRLCTWIRGDNNGWLAGQARQFRARNQMTGMALLRAISPAGCCGEGCALVGRYHITYAADPGYADVRDSRLYSAQGYGVPVTVPLAPNVRHTYNYSWGIPASRLTPVSNPTHRVAPAGK